MVAERDTEKVSHRNHPVRSLQTRFQGSVPMVMDALNNWGWLDDTRVSEVLMKGGELHPDDITLAGLQITVKTSESLVSGTAIKKARQFIVGFMLDGADGALARHLNLASPDGAVKDVLVDRAADTYMAALVADEIKKYEDGSENLAEELQTAFQFSTLTKAMSEMEGVVTDEGGAGSMVQRRIALMSILWNLGGLNSEKLSRKKQERKLSIIDERIDWLKQSSLLKARDRTKKMLLNNQSGIFGMKDILEDPQTAAATEARKYTAIVRLNELKGLDIVSRLDSLLGGARFPTDNDLRERYPYIEDSINAVDPFLGEVLEITGGK